MAAILLPTTFVLILALDSRASSSLANTTAAACCLLPVAALGSIILLPKYGHREYAYCTVPLHLQLNHTFSNTALFPHGVLLRRTPWDLLAVWYNLFPVTISSSAMLVGETIPFFSLYFLFAYEYYTVEELLPVRWMITLWGGKLLSGRWSTLECHWWYLLYVLVIVSP